MSKKDMQSAVPFREGIRQFVEWLGSDYYLCSWGKDDRIHLIDECIRKKVGLGWLRNYNDIQQQIGALLREDNRNQLGLQNALELAHIEPTGLAHRGIDDAINTARLLIHLLDRIKLQRNEVTDKEIAQFKLRLQRKRQERKKLLNQANQKARTTASESLDTEPS
jgi:inhibitor of KinA sporulation pathway (predicted exonuclease)